MYSTSVSVKEKPLPVSRPIVALRPSTETRMSMSASRALRPGSDPCGPSGSKPGIETVSRPAPPSMVSLPPLPQK